MSDEVYIHKINNPADNYLYPFQTCYNLKRCEAYVENIGGSLEKCEVIVDEDSPFFGDIKTPCFAKNPIYLKVIIKLT